MKHTTTQNAKLMKILSERPQIMETMVNTSDLDDEQLYQYYDFLKWYDSLSQIDKDLFFLIYSGHSIREIAELMDCSQSYVYGKRKLLRRQ